MLEHFLSTLALKKDDEKLRGGKKTRDKGELHGDKSEVVGTEDRISEVNVYYYEI